MTCSSWLKIIRHSTLSSLFSYNSLSTAESNLITDVQIFTPSSELVKNLIFHDIEARVQTKGHFQTVYELEWNLF